MSKIYTKTGDKGQTSLYGGTRIGKDSFQVDAYGTIDTANVSIGVVRSILNEKNLKDILYICQSKLFEVAAFVASDDTGKNRLRDNITEDDVSFIEKSIDILSENLNKIDYFIVPGRSIESALLHNARVNVRAAERKLVRLSHEQNGLEIYLEYLNRLSDLLYTMARYVDEIEKNKIDDFKSVNLLSIARNIEKACLDKAIEIGVPMAVAVADNYGEVVSFGAMDETLRISYKLAKDKAYTAAVLKSDTENLAKLAQPGQSLYGVENSDNIIIFGGGIALFSNGKLVLSIGVSGGSVDEDIIVAKAGESVFYKEYRCE